MPTPKPRKDKNNISDTIVLMDFYDALRQVMNGKKITRVEWDSDDYVFLSQQDHLLHINLGGVDRALLLSEWDIIAEDWRIVE